MTDTTSRTTTVSLSRPWPRSMVVAGLLTFAAVTTGCTRGGEVADAQPAAALRFGVLPAVDANKTAEIYVPMCKALSTALGREVTLHVADNYEALLADMLTGKAQLAQVSSYLFVRAAMLRKRAKQPFHIVA